MTSLQRALARDQIDENPFEPLGDETRHYWRVMRMAKATGVDLIGARASGALSAADWADTVQACRGCSWRAGCQRWLDQAALEGEPRPLPQGCANAPSLGAMRDGAPDATA